MFFHENIYRTNIDLGTLALDDFNKSQQPANDESVILKSPLQTIEEAPKPNTEEINQEVEFDYEIKLNKAEFPTDAPQTEIDRLLNEKEIIDTQQPNSEQHTNQKQPFVKHINKLMLIETAVGLLVIGTVLFLTYKFYKSIKS